MKKLGLAVVAAAAVGLFAGNAMAQSAKFAAVYDTDTIIAGTGLVTVTDGQATRDVMGAEVDMASIHVAQKKSLLIGVSAQTGIYTMTEAKGRNKATDGSCDPGSTKSTAEGAVEVYVELVRQSDGLIVPAAPGSIIFDARLQELTVSSCTDEYVAVKLVLDTTAAHHFNFLGVQLDQGTYDIVATYDLSAFAGVLGQDGSAQARVALGPRVVTAQEVRAVKDSIVDDTDTGNQFCPSDFHWDGTDCVPDV